ncbi:glycosyltransferase family 9 protein [Humitalea sp. 24SJ18S-53]|uniref:glycosyltransferase family 9 protein n=1 Tax=Humitalea sp. 24SJ18S-53 TaxID=3422307 RepID=UPI003D66B648
MRILFITSTRIGDAVLSTALLDHLLRQHPGARITIACGPAAVEVFARMPGRDATISVTKRRWSLHWPLLWAQVAPRWWDLVVDLRGSAMAWMVPARRRAVMRGGRRAGHRMGHIAETLGLTAADIAPVAWFDAADAARGAALLPGAGPLLALGPTANWDRKIWPAERFVAVARALTAPDGPLPGARIAVMGGPGDAERALAAPVLAGLPGSVDLVGRLSLPEAAAVLAGASLYLGNDSGLMHLAAAAGAPTLGLFGMSPANEYAPFGPHAAAVVADGPPGHAPMEALPVDRVIAAAERLLGAPVPA